MARHWKRIICKSKCAKHGMLAHILEDWIWINWTLGREAGIVDLHVHKFAHETVLLARVLEDSIWENCTALWREAHL